jgi:hypothetical protein
MGREFRCWSTLIVKEGKCGLPKSPRVVVTFRRLPRDHFSNSTTIFRHFFRATLGRSSILSKEKLLANSVLPRCSRQSTGDIRIAQRTWIPPRDCQYDSIPTSDLYRCPSTYLSSNISIVQETYGIIEKEEGIQNLEVFSLHGHLHSCE